MKAPLYRLDANVFIEAKKGPYGSKLVPQYWVFLSEQMEQGTVRCPKMVYDELIDGNDDLAAWFKPRREKGLCYPANESVQLCLTTIANHVVANYKSHQA